MTVEPTPAPVERRRLQLDTLSSPDQLDQLMEVTRLRSWLALAGLALLLAVALAWSIFGTISTKVFAEGMLITPGGLFDVHAPDEGSIRQLHVTEGALVEKGQIVATIDQPELTAQIEGLRAALAQQRERLRELVEPAGVYRRLAPDALALARVNQQATVENTERSLAELSQRLEDTSHIDSPYSGRILEIKVRPGDIVSRGSKLLSFQLSGQGTKGLQAVIYVPSADGKNIAPGMPVEISPSTAAREEYGFLLATVTYISEFPATREGMMRVLANEELVASLSTEGPPFAAYADLVTDTAAAGGYRWSSPKGSELKVNSGTPCDVFITVREQRPIEMVLPLVRQFSGL